MLIKISKWQPTPVLLARKFHGQRSLVGVHGIAKSRTQLSNFIHSLTHSLLFLLLMTVITPGSKLKTLILKNLTNSDQRVRN